MAINDLKDYYVLFFVQCQIICLAWVFLSGFFLGVKAHTWLRNRSTWLKRDVAFCASNFCAVMRKFFKASLAPCREMPPQFVANGRVCLENFQENMVVKVGV